ncbi:MarR family winged helix-turn-helix transcriptional regulator [Echinimonas agarilytica]|uniref:MarR family transcriptional regulator n=1 Tax=Echinimonas agarilytica TaxID=1215918 RepID=A0AA42B7L6_9GAMM|nr:MarR family transcriptional regulator [Echinimonas agarilytica]MCM2680305.1 MarR family transcriptional regulator [Echinimonas agarilytica]
MSQLRSLDDVFFLVHTLKRQMHERVEQLGLNITPMHVRVMKVIQRKSPCTAVDVAQFLHRDKGQITRLLNALLELELVQKVPNPEDKRSQCLLITDKGERIFKHVATIDTQVLDKMTQNITPEEIAEFQRIASRMAENLAE